MPSLETEIKRGLEDLQNNWSEFKTADAQGKKKTSAEIDDRLEKISVAMDDNEEKIKSFETALARENNGGVDEVAQGYRNEFDGFVRAENGINSLRDFVMKNELSVSVSVDGEGGVTLPEELDSQILKLAEDRSSMRPYARTKQIGGSVYRKLVQHGGVDSGWVGEKDSRPDTGTPTFSDITPTMGEIYAQPKATQDMLDDAFFSVEDMFVDEGGLEFFRKEESAFVVGDGVKKPLGILAGTMDYNVDSGRAFGTIQKIKTGVANALPAAEDMFNWLLDFQDELKEEHAAMAVWMMHRKTKTAVRKVKNTDGNYVWEPSVRIGQPSMLLGAPCVTNTYFPTVAANSLPLLFGDIHAAYTIVDRRGIRTLRDPYTQKPYTKFYMTKRVGSMFEDSEAIKIAECAL